MGQDGNEEGPRRERTGVADPTGKCERDNIGFFQRYRFWAEPSPAPAWVRGAGGTRLLPCTPFPNGDRPMTQHAAASTRTLTGAAR